MSRANTQKHPYSRLSHIDTRFTNADRALVERAATAASLPLSAFVRGAAVDEARRRLGYPVVTQTLISDEDRAALDTARLEVKRVGVNLNQMTRLAHHGLLDLGLLGPAVKDLAAAYIDLVDLLGGSSS